MKNLVIPFVNSWFLISSVFLQAQPLTYSKVFYDSQFFGIRANSVVPSFNNGFMIAGNANYQTGFIIKLDSAGNASWNKKFAYDFNSIIRTNDSCFVLVGNVVNPNNAHLDACCIKINTNGDTIWSKAISLNGYNNLTALSVNQTIDSGYILAGYAIDPLSQHNRIFAARLDLTGTLQWTNVLTGGNQYNTVGSSVAQTPDSGYIIAGYLDTYPPYISYALLSKLSPSGTFLWAKKFKLTSNLSCSANDVEITNGGLLCYLNMGYNAMLMKTDYSGNILWNKSYYMLAGGTGGSPTAKIHKTSDGAFVFGPFGGSELIKTDSTGNVIWAKRLFLMLADEVILNPNEYFIVGNGPMLGSIPHGNVYSPQIGIIKTDSLSLSQTCVNPDFVMLANDSIISSIESFAVLNGGNGITIHPVIDTLVIVTDSGCVDAFGGVHETNLENDFIVYPNPSTGNFTFMAMKTRPAQITIFNSFGQTIYQSEINNLKSQIDLTAQPKGIYFYKIISTDKNMVTGKLVIMD